MITYDEVLNLNYYKKTSYTGWTGGMRFMIARREPEAAEGNDAGIPESANPQPFFEVFAWPGPYNFEKTDDSRKRHARFPFTEEGRIACVDWLNRQLEEGDWPRNKVAGIWQG